MKTAAIILSAGKGTRMKTDISKQYISVNGYPVLYYSLKAFEESNVDEIIIVVGKDDIGYVKKEIVDKYSVKKVKNIVAGGKERYNSVINGLEEVADCENVLVHDGARPLIQCSVINKMIEEVSKGKSCIAAMPVKDTIKISDGDGFVQYTPPRNHVWQIQTPQAFKTEVLKKAYYDMSLAGDNTVTDDSMVVERYTSEKIELIEADYSNIKITTPEDLVFMEQYLVKKNV